MVVDPFRELLRGAVGVGAAATAVLAAWRALAPEALGPDRLDAWTWLALAVLGVLLRAWLDPPDRGAAARRHLGEPRSPPR